ncbi:hypothetical protein GCM10028805_52370 [Spirosoma harenae]
MIDYIQVGQVNLTYQRLISRWSPVLTHDIIELARAEANDQPSEFALVLDRVRLNLIRLIDTLGPGRTSGQRIALLLTRAREAASYASIEQLIAKIDALDQAEDRLD